MYELLSEPVRKYIRDKRWEALRPIQNAAIQRIISTNKNYILASRTASGKTEAAFLPILSKVNFKTAGVRVLYISPLIALINDQFVRIEELCDYLDVKVTKWHGEANRSLKETLIKKPEGVVLITPESLEAMFVNAPSNVSHLFENLAYVVIDEIHSFVGTDRGTQLKSILSRLQYLNKESYKIVGLSATIGEFDEVKKITGTVTDTVVLRDKVSKEMEAEFKFFKQEGADLPLELIEDLYEKTKANKVLIFPNSRGRAEEVAVRLKKLSDRRRGHGYYFSHHSSVDKELREYIEQFAKNNKRYPFAISCTSTLELGIDIGSVDKVVQIDAASSISSLVQRVGRSGRQDEAISKLLFYATDPWSVLQSLACLTLYREGIVEPLYGVAQPYDISLHQMLSTVKQLSGCTFPELQLRISQNYAFYDIEPNAITDIVRHLLKIEMLQLVENELIIGVAGERIVNNKDFYSVFKSEPSFSVVNYDKIIGEIPLLSIIQVDENILLAARIWKVVDIDYKAKKIAVVPAKDGNKPKFFGTGADVHDLIRSRMMLLLKDNSVWPELDEAATESLRQLRKDFAGFQIENFATDRPLAEKNTEVKLYTFQGTKLNRSLQFIFSLLGVESGYVDHESSFVFKTDRERLAKLFNQVSEKINEIETHLKNALIANPALIEFSKWGAYLPIKYQLRLIKNQNYDFEHLRNFAENLRLTIWEKSSS